MPGPNPLVKSAEAHDVFNSVVVYPVVHATQQLNYEQNRGISGQCGMHISFVLGICVPIVMKKANVEVVMVEARRSSRNSDCRK